MKKISGKFRYIAVAALVTAFLIFLDQLSKRIVVYYIPYPDAPTYDVIPYLFNVTHVRNTGAAFSFGADSAIAMPIFIAVTAVCLVVLAFAIAKWGKRSKLLLSALCLIFAGSAGNLIDRLTNFGADGKRYVVDFIRFTFWPQFATFNFADVCVCVGAVLFLIYVLFFEGRKEKREKKKDLAKGDGGNA